MELPQRKLINHRGPLSVNVVGAWYFITICAEGHKPWSVGGAPRAPRDIDQSREIPLVHAAEMILAESREYQRRGVWCLALMLVMPDHVHFIVHGPSGGRPLPRLIGDFKRLVTSRYGLRFQRNFWDTRIRDEAHYAEKFRYVCNNPVRKGLCACACDWPYVIAFDRESGEERLHRNFGLVSAKLR